MVPDCAELPSAFRMGRDYPRREFEARIEPLDKSSRGWSVFGRCRDCGQIWLLDMWDKYASDLAIKVLDLATWTSEAERAARIDYLRRSRGGDAPSGECIVAGCSRRPLKGIAYCAEHAFERAGAWA